MSQHPSFISDDRRRFLMQAATYASVGLAAVLVIIKGIAWVHTDAVSVLSSLADSVLDGLASLLNFFAVRQALLPADSEHRYGHGKAEALSALAQAAFIAVSGLGLLWEATERFVTPVVPEDMFLGIGVMSISILLTGLLVAFQRYVMRLTQSVAIQADSLHYEIDLVVNLCVIGALLAIHYCGWLWADPLTAVCIAASIIYASWRILRHALDILMDRELSDEVREEIIAIARHHPAVQEVADLRTRSAGHSVFIQMNVRMCGTLSLQEAHEISHEVEEAVRAYFPNSEVMIHQEPQHPDPDSPLSVKMKRD